jgi:hypothetical protein
MELSMKRMAVLLLLIGCGGSVSDAFDGGSGNTGTQAVAIVLSQTDIQIAAGAITSFAVTATYRDGSQADVTAQAQAASSNPQVATVAHGKRR